jgi:hypothetical protein
LALPDSLTDDGGRIPFGQRWLDSQFKIVRLISSPPEHAPTRNIAPRVGLSQVAVR